AGVRSLRQIAASLLLACTVEHAVADPAVNLAALEVAVDQDDLAALNALAVRYEHAEGVPKDLDKAKTLYCRAAKQGSADAQFNLGWIYANGRGVPRDDGIAAALFEMAAEQ